MGLFGGDVNVNKHGRKWSGMFKQSLKTAQKSKKEGKLDGKTWWCEAEGRCAWEILLWEKLEECKSVCYRSSTKQTYIYPRWICPVFGILWNARPGEFLKLFVHKGTQQLACLVIIQDDAGCSLCPLKQFHESEHVLSLGPRLSHFSEVCYVFEG